MQYPDCLRQLPEPFPLLGHELSGKPFILDMSPESTQTANLDLHDQSGIQAYIDSFFAEGYTWGLGNYLENRERLLGIYPQMQQEQRYFHLGLDVIAPLGTELYCPLSGMVVQSTHEAGDGNYGGVVILEHTGSFETFYSLYGHLDTDCLPSVGSEIFRGDTFARMGDFDHNGNWFYHTHLQVLTRSGWAEGWISKGYCTAKQKSIIDRYCPSPLHLFAPITELHPSRLTHEAV